MPERLDFPRLASRLRDILSLEEPQPASTLAERLGISQPSFSRLVGTEPRIVSFGRARKTRYALLRQDGRLPERIPVHRIDAEGRVHPFLELVPLANEGFLATGSEETFHEGLPWYLEDGRPQGFLGRLVPRRHPNLGLPDDVRLWSATHVLTWQIEHAWNLPGDLVVGEPALQRWLEHAETPPDLVPEEERETIYPRLSRDVLGSALAGSSAAGEQPKFLATRADLDGPVPVLVKFSPSSDDEIALRVRDLLRCEHLAARILDSAGHPTCRTQFLTNGGRAFLEVERFDRIGWPGRRGTVTLATLDAAFTGVARDWVSITEALVRAKHLPTEILEPVRWRAAFAELIANTDAHAGNLTFFREGFEVRELAPSYDMLPMAFAPRANELVEPNWTPPPPCPGALWRSAWEHAREFWDAVSADAHISIVFGARARAIRDALDEQRRSLDRLPH